MDICVINEVLFGAIRDLKEGKSRTYRQALDALFDAFKGYGWKVSAPNLKVRWVQKPRENFRVWFKPQAVYYGWTSNLGSARSVHIPNIKSATVKQMLGHINYYYELGPDED